MKGVVYKYTFANGKVYIGQTRRHPEKRIREHFDASTGPTNSGFWEAYKKYGEPAYEELYEVEIENEDELVWTLNLMETNFIQLYRADCPEYGYNIKSYGMTATDSNKILRRKYAELKRILLAQRLQVYNSAVEKIFRTKLALTEEEKYLIKEKYREQNVFQYDIDNFDLDNLSEDAEVSIMVEDAIDFVRFMITEEVEEEVEQIVRENYMQILHEEREKKAIVQLDKEGKVIREYFSFNEICQAFNVPRSDNVKNVLKGKQKSAYGFLWKYKKDL